MAPRGKRAKASERPALSSALANALRFIAIAQKDTGAPYETHCILNNGYAVASNGIISAGQLIEEPIKACPHTFRLLDALTKCGDNLSITQLDSEKLSIRSDKFKAIVPCISPNQLNVIAPDAACAVIDDRLKEGFEAVGVLVSDTSPAVITASILLQANTMISTNRHIMLEYWHGIDLPSGLVIPKAAINAVMKAGKPLDKLGFSDASVTFYFTDKSWIKTQLYNEKYPDISKIFSFNPNAWPLPLGFYQALAAIENFSENNHAYFRANELASHNTEGVGASYELTGLPEGLIFSIKYLKLIEPFITSIDFVGNAGVAYFFGDNMRGAICGIKE